MPQASTEFPVADVAQDMPSASWSYEEAFVRHRGLIAPDEQQRLRRCRVAIAGMGGVGGIDLITLARLGVGRFTIADPECFEAANMNRQFGALVSTLGEPKVDVMRRMVTDINPEAQVRVFRQPLSAANAQEFLEDADVFVDAVDFFEPVVRRRLFQTARQRGIYALTAGPIGFSAIWIVFAPDGMSFDQYFDIHDGMGFADQVIAFGTGIAPRALQFAYLGLDTVDIDRRMGPSCGMACNLAAAAVGTTVLKILLKRGKVRAAPYYHQFDSYLDRLVVRRLWWGNRNPLQRIKRWWLSRHFRQRTNSGP